MSGHLGTAPTGPIAPPAQAKRATAPGWRDARLWVGLLIVAACVVAGARLLASADDTIAVWAARSDMVAGTRLSEDDLVAVRVRFREESNLDAYVRAETSWSGGDVLLRDLAAGELIPAAATGEEVSEEVRYVPVTVPAGQVPASVEAGSTVDVWAASGTTTDDAEAALLFEAVRVSEMPTPDSTIGAAADQQLVLAVPEEQHEAIAAALAAIAAGTVTIAQRS